VGDEAPALSPTKFLQMINKKNGFVYTFKNKSRGYPIIIPYVLPFNQMILVCNDCDKKFPTVDGQTFNLYRLIKPHPTQEV
jgi:hypothetical protein